MGVHAPAVLIWKTLAVPPVLLDQGVLNLYFARDGGAVANSMHATLWKAPWRSLLDIVLRLPNPPSHFDVLPCDYHVKGRCAFLGGRGCRPSPLTSGDRHRRSSVSDATAWEEKWAVPGRTMLLFHFT